MTVLSFSNARYAYAQEGIPEVSTVSFKESGLYVPVLLETEAGLLLALAAANGDKVVLTDTQQAYLCCDMGDDVVYIQPPDWWPA